MLPTYWAPVQVPGGRGLRTPPQRFGPAPNPFVFVTTRERPSGVTATLDGYQAVGMNPTVRRLCRSTTAIASSPASATYSVSPSGATASPSGFDPFGPSGTRPTGIVAASRSRRVSITETVSLLEFAVYASSRRGFAAISLGWSAWSGSVAGESSMPPTEVCVLV